MPSQTGPGPAAADSERAEPIVIGGVTVRPGTRETIDLPLSLLSNHTPMTLTVLAVHGRRPGPRLLVNAALHGDEINGVEIIRRLLRHRSLNRLSGTLIAAPVVNVYGFVTHARYLPDRRDLNRSFPGSPNGSLTGRLAHLFLTEVVGKCTHGIDLHTGAIHRSNLPQVRADLSDHEVSRLAHAFAMPVVLNAVLRQGSLRRAAIDMGIPLLVFEGGEALRFDEMAIQAGLNGILRVMACLGMIRLRGVARPNNASIVAQSSTWVRAPNGGVLRSACRLGALVAEGDVIGIVADPFGASEFPVQATTSGILIGRTNLPVVNQGDGLFHIARVADSDAAAAAVESFYEDWEQDAISA